VLLRYVARGILSELTGTKGISVTGKHKVPVQPWFLAPEQQQQTVKTNQQQQLERFISGLVINLGVMDMGCSWENTPRVFSSFTRSRSRYSPIFTFSSCPFTVPGESGGIFVKIRGSGSW